MSLGGGDDDQVRHTELAAMTRYRWEEQQSLMCLLINFIKIPVLATKSLAASFF